MNRRDLLKTIGLAVGSGIIHTDVIGSVGDDTYFYDGHGIHRENIVLDRPVTAITLGCGGRGRVYGNYAKKFPRNLKIIGLAEPNPLRNESYAKTHQVVRENRFDTWENVFKRPKFADVIIISTPDDLHYGPCMQALRMGYDVLLEKPIAPTERECRDILALAKKTNRIVAVCHVLRYSPYFIKMKELLDKGAIGELISVQHLEPIEHTHMAHSFVRGIWRNSKTSTPIILAKSCHDLDILRFVINKRAKKIVAMGDLKWFRKENAPEGSTPRCTDGCKVERECPYSAIKEYHDRYMRWRVAALDVDVSEGRDRKAIQRDVMEKLKTSNYGKCVYHTDNDQPDHYVASMLFEDNVTVNFSMEAFTSDHGRKTRLMGSMGDLIGDMHELVHTDFRTGKSTKFVPKYSDVEGYQNAGHGGGDWLMVKDFVQAVAERRHDLLTSTIDDSIESHIMAFMAEKSRKTGKVVDIKL